MVTGSAKNFKYFKDSVKYFNYYLLCYVRTSIPKILNACGCSCNTTITTNLISNVLVKLREEKNSVSIGVVSNPPMLSTFDSFFLY